jgi:hypothetical protein
MGCGDQADIHFVSLIAAETLEFLFLKNAQEFRLKLERDVADFIEKERAFVGEFEAACFLGDGAGERAFLVTEALALQ